MPGKNEQLKKLLKDKSFLLFLSGQGISNFGDAFHFIAITILLVKLAGSGLSAILGMICSQAPSLILSPFAGYLGDRFNEKNLCIVMDLLRGFVAIMFVGNYNTFEVYALILLLSMLDIVYAPARKKIVVNIIRERELLMGNSLLMGISGAAFMVGPFLASIIIGIWGSDIAFFINSMSFVFSALTVLFVRMKAYGAAVLRAAREPLRNALEDIKDGFKYFRSAQAIKEFIILSAVAGTAAASVNIAFYPFAFDTLRVTDKGWGLMMSVFYGTNLLAMFISIFFNKKINKGMMPFIYTSLIIICIVWFYYGMTEDLYTVLLLQFIEGTILAFSSILFGTKLQSIVNKAYMARVMSIGDIIGNIFRMAGIGTTCFMLAFVQEKFVFFMNSAFLLIFIVYKMLTCGSSGKKAASSIY